MGVIAIKASATASMEVAGATERPRMGELLDVAGRLFNEKGYRSTSLNDIGTALGMNKASLYHYVRSKEDLLRHLVLRASRRLRDVSRNPRIDTMAPAEALEVLVREHCAVILEHPDGFGILIQQRRFIEPAALGEVIEREGVYLAHVREIIARGIAQGVFRAMDSSIATALVMDTVNGLLRWYKPQGRLTVSQVVDEIWVYVLAGISAPIRKSPRTRKVNS